MKMPMLLFSVVTPIEFLKMEAVCSSVTLVPIYKPTRRYNPEDQHQHLFVYFSRITQWML
jgi:hypothetical protein